LPPRVNPENKKKPKTAPPKTDERNSSKALEKMRANDKGDWSIEDIDKACSQLGITCSAPGNGSHYKISSPHIQGILTVPAKRPIKRWYIKKFLEFADAHVWQKSKGEKKDG
jgi:hypothetical protein